MAAKRATDVYAYGEAVRLLEQALKVQEILDPEDKGKRCDLLLDLCDALLLAVENKRILDTAAPEAFALAEAIGDGSRAVRACVVAIMAILNEQSALGLATPQAAEWAERANRYARPNTIERALADMALGATRYAGGHLRSGGKLLSQAVELARNLGDPNTLWMTGCALLLYPTAPQHAQERTRFAEELLASPRVGVNALAAGIALEVAGNAFLALGQRQHAEETWGELRAMAKHTGQLSTWVMSTGINAVLTLMDGRLEDAMDMAGRIRSRGEEVGASQNVNVYMHAGFADYRAQVYLGRKLEALERALRDVSGVADRFSAMALLPLVLAHLGQKDEVSEILERLVVRRPGIATAEDGTATYWDTLHLETAVLAGHQRAAELLLNRFAGTSVVTSGIYYPTCIPRHLGGAAALLGRYDEARKYYQEAVKVCTEMKFRPELALTRLQLAELILEHYPAEKKEALEHLDFAIAEFQDMKMQPSLERALRHKEILKA